jgi:hypothetical protein
MFSESLETIFCVKILKFFEADPGSGMEKIRIRDTGMHCILNCLYSFFCIGGEMLPRNPARIPADFGANPPEALHSY